MVIFLRLGRVSNLLEMRKRSVAAVVVVVALSVAACTSPAPSATNKGSVQRACKLVAQLGPFPIPTGTDVKSTNGASALFGQFLIQRTLVKGIEESSNSALTQAGKDMVTAEKDDNGLAANAAVIHARSVCESLGYIA
jgi:hypothetical protein